jgi:hypothetical protein
MGHGSEWDVSKGFEQKILAVATTYSSAVLLKRQLTRRTVLVGEELGRCHANVYTIVSNGSYQ